MIGIVSQNRNATGNDFGLDRIKFYECQEIGLNIEDNKLIIFKNVLFYTKRAIILESSYAELNKLLDYLIQKGVDNNRISANGYGENNPIDTNETIEGRQKYWRVEFVVM